MIAQISKGLPDESINSITTSSNSLSPKLKWIYNSKIPVEFKESCLEQDMATSICRNVVNFFVVYELDTWKRALNTKYALGDCLFRAAKLTQNADSNKYAYSGYDIALIHVQIVQ